jgi:hypothetical protein
MTGNEITKLYNKAAVTGSLPFEDVRRLIEHVAELGAQLDTALKTAHVWRQRAHLSHLDASEPTDYGSLGDMSPFTMHAAEPRD